VRWGRTPKSSSNQTVIYLAPTKIDKRSTTTKQSLIRAPSRSTNRVIDIAVKKAPSTTTNTSYSESISYDYSPSTSLYTDFDYEPVDYRSTKYVIREAPSVTLQFSNRYAPVSRQSFNYQPVLNSVFRPQPVLVSNYDALNSYYTFLIQLLKALR